MTINHPENFGEDSALPITDEYVDEVLNDEFGIPDGLEDVTPRVDIARKVFELTRNIDSSVDNSYLSFVDGLAVLARNDDGEYDDFRMMQIVFRLARMTEALLAITRDFCTDEDNPNCTGARDFDESFFAMLNGELDMLLEDKFTPYWDSSRARHSEGGTGENADDEVRTFRFSYSCDFDCVSADHALIELAETVADMLEPTSQAQPWSMVEYSDIVLLDEEGDVVTSRQVQLGQNSARLKGFLGLIKQSEFVYVDERST